MSKLYLHKKKSGEFNTSKHTIVADMDKLKEIYTFKESFLKTNNPKELIIKGDNVDEFSYSVKLENIPVEKVIIDANVIQQHKCTILNFKDCKELVVTENCKNINIFNNFGIQNVEHIVIPYNIENFENNIGFFNKVKKITVKDKEKHFSINLKEPFIGRRLNIFAYNKGNDLTIFLFSDTESLKYTIVFLKNNISYYTSQYIKRKIDVCEEEFNLIELKKQYDCKIEFNKLECEKIILTKEDLAILCKSNFDKTKLKEIEMQDNNQMLLMPKKHSIKLTSDEIITNFNNLTFGNGIFLIEILDSISYKKRYVIITENSYIYEISSLKEIYFDCNAKISEYDKISQKLVLPILNEGFIIKSGGLKNLISSENIQVFIKNNEDIIELQKKSFISEINYNNDCFNITYKDKFFKRIKSIIRYSFNPLEKYYYKNESNQLKIKEELKKFVNYNDELPRIISRDNHLPRPKSGGVINSSAKKLIKKY